MSELGDDDGDGLAVVVDLGVLEDGEVAAGGRLGRADGELGGVEGGEDGEDAGGALGGGAVDGGDGAGGDGGLDDVGVDEVLAGEGLRELGGVLGFAGDLGDAVVAVGELLRVRAWAAAVLHGDHAWTPCGGEGEGAHDALFGQLDLEGVVLVAAWRRRGRGRRPCGRFRGWRAGR